MQPHMAYSTGVWHEPLAHGITTLTGQGAAASQRAALPVTPPLQQNSNGDFKLAQRHRCL